MSVEMQQRGLRQRGRLTTREVITGRIHDHVELLKK